MSTYCPAEMSEVKEEQNERLSEKDDEKLSKADDEKISRKSQSTKKRKAEEKHNEEDLEDGSTAPSNKKIKEDNDNTILVAKHYNSIVNKGLNFRDKSRILYMRNFNNWIKSMLILKFVTETKQKRHNQSSRLKVLDMCCGKGGDLFKWGKMNIGYLICCDLAEMTVQQCEDRYNDMKKRCKNSEKDLLFKAEFLTEDCTKVRLRSKFEDASISLDLVSCQFAFHYCFESLQQAECMMRNASECLKEGGYFIGTIPNAYELVSRWQKSNGDNFGNDIYNVKFFCDKTKPPLFGAKYHFQLEGVVNCPEFLVYLPIFRKLALKFGLRLVLFERFEQFYEKSKETGEMLLHKIQAVEPYPPRDVPLVGDPDRDYEHAKEYMRQNKRNNSNRDSEIGTLSQSEWEVISLYAVFAFEKMKTIWDEDGRPEYV